MKATVQWQGNMTFAGVSKSNHTVFMDADPTVGGTDSGVRPMELLALGLAGCTGMDVLSILKKKRQHVTQFEVTVDAPRSPEFPQVFTSAVVTYIVTGTKIEETAVLRSIELAATKYCSAQIMLAQAFPMDLRYEIYEDEGNENKLLTHQGIWPGVSAD